MRSFFVSAAAAAAAAAGLIAGPAFAHSKLVSANPAPSATVRSVPAQLQLNFNEPLIQRFVTLAVTGPDGATLHVATVTVDPKKKSRVNAVVHGFGKPGAYKVAWTAAGSDMHRMTGSYSFTLRR
ncbi:MAG TPA: copper resistance protein CopC [Allosphingosinicella sp.]